MAACIWIQYAPAATAIPYVGFIHATVTGDTASPPPLPASRSQVSVPLGTQTYGVLVKSIANGVPTLVPDPAFDSGAIANLGGSGGLTNGPSGVAVP